MALSHLAHIPPEHRPNCAACPFRDEKTGEPRHRPVLGIRPRTCKGVLVGEGPGGEEVEQSEPFVGNTGRWLKMKLAQSKLNYDDFAVLNATACQPPKGMKSDANMGHATKACRPLFDWQYAPYKGKKKVLAMGKWAGAAVNGSTISTETGRGFIRSWGILTWHPTYVAYYNTWKVGEFLNDIDRYSRMLHGLLEAPPTTIIKPTVADVVRLVKGAKGVVACDIETRAPHGQPNHLGKDPTRADLRTIALGTPNLGVAYWWGSDNNVQQTIIRVLQDKKILKVFHNGYFFDLRVLRRYGVNVVNVIDTRDMRRAVSAVSRLSLRFLASVYSDFAPWKEDEK